MNDAKRSADHRERIYRHYVRSFQYELAPRTLTGLNQRAPYLNRLIARHFPAEKRSTILDLGCGYGALVHLVREAGYKQVTGIDISPEQVAEAERLGVKGIRQGDLLARLCTFRLRNIRYQQDEKRMNAAI